MLTPALVAMRDLYMKSGHGFLLVFSICSKASFEELESIRDDIIRIKDDEDIPIVIVGNKSDLEDMRAVDRAKAFALSQRWNAPYYEASARTRSRLPQPITHSLGLVSCPLCLSMCSFFFPLTVALLYLANVDEAFLHLCRQMLQREDSQDAQSKDDHMSQRGDEYSTKRRRRRRRKEKCAIL